MKYEVKNPLPEKFSAAIRLAIRDMQALAKSSKYKIDMNFWHEVIPSENRCHVCMAGAVLTRNFHVKRHEDVLNHDIFDTDQRLKAFDFLRSGLVSLALKRYVRPYNKPYKSGRFIASDRKVESDWVKMAFRVSDLPYKSYTISPKKFYKWCNEVANILEENGY